MEAISLYRLHQQIRRIMALNFPEAVFIKAEIVKINESRGHYYIEVADKDNEGDHVRAKAQAVIWRNQYAALKRRHKDLLNELLQEGMKIAFHAKVDFHEVYGLKLMIEDIDVEYTLGAVAQERAAIIERLAKENLLEQNAGVALPQVLQRIAIISSKTAAGLEDFVNSLHHNAYGLGFYTELFPAAMQGVSVEKEVVRQLSNIDARSEHFDTIVIIRGGGGKLDLAYFDNYQIGKTIAASSLAVLTGIGHQADQTVTDLVAHTSLKTPTAVAEFIINRNMIFLQRIEQHYTEIDRLSRKIIEDEFWSLRLVVEEIKSKSNQLIRAHNSDLNTIQEKLRTLVDQNFEREEQQLHSLFKQVELMDPQNIFERGFTAIEQDDKRISKSSALRRNKNFYIYFSDTKQEIERNDKQK